MLLAYDLGIYLVLGILIVGFYPSYVDKLGFWDVVINILVGLLCIFLPRLAIGIYNYIWRYAGAEEFINLILADIIGLVLFLAVGRIIPQPLTFIHTVSLVAFNLLINISLRLVYVYIYRQRSSNAFAEQWALQLLRLFTGVNFHMETPTNADRRIKIAIVGAGSIGAMLAEELQGNPKAPYQVVCFVDVNQEKTGRNILGIRVLGEGVNLHSQMEALGVQEVVIALPNASPETKQQMYDLYRGYGYRVKAYDYPTIENGANSRPQMREFNMEELLFRREETFVEEKTKAWYRGRRVLITGGGGSIGSELARQVAHMEPELLVLLDIYENGVYDIQQELKFKYGDKLKLQVEIANVCDRSAMEAIFATYRPDIVLHAAAHKHVPLMEHNCCEAVRNNVFGTLTTVETSEKYGVKRFIMISTDKAVNPTNVMGATKRVCEMIVQSRTGSGTSFSATRFGNVLGSNGSVIPLFRRMIENGGPVTITDKRIIRYFMTIPEASQLVLTSGAMASNGELYVLDMGKPVKIIELAERMIRMAGQDPYKDINIVESGLRPGEKLYEELLIRGENIGNTDNKMIFIERDKPLSREEMDGRIEILREALVSGSDDELRQALKRVLPTYRSPEEVNRNAEHAEEMKTLAQ